MITSQTALPTGPGNPSTTGIAPNLSDLLTDHFHDPLTVENFRRQVRSCFSAYVIAPDFEARFGPFDLEGILYCSEAIDELLSAIIRDILNQTGN